jgi:hypothetical protein
MSNRIRQITVLAASLTIGACSARDHGTAGSSFGSLSPVGPSVIAADPLRAVPIPAAAASAGGTLKETLTGPAIGGVVPEGQALADESRFQSGGDTILTVQIKKVNLPDGALLDVSLDFSPIGRITLARGEGTLTANLGHFGVSFDQIRVKNGSVTILSGGFFQ